MIDLLGIVDNVFTVLSVTKSASELNDEASESDKNSQSKEQSREAVAQQRLDEMKATREEQAGQEDSEQLQQKR
jgi:hypothetical protein